MNNFDNSHSPHSLLTRKTLTTFTISCINIFMARASDSSNGRYFKVLWFVSDLEISMQTHAILEPWGEILEGGTVNGHVHKSIFLWKEETSVFTRGNIPWTLSSRMRLKVRSFMRHHVLRTCREIIQGRTAADWWDQQVWLWWLGLYQRLSGDSSLCPRQLYRRDRPTRGLIGGSITETLRHIDCH